MDGLYPIFLNLAGRPCLVVGGGAVAERKTEELLKCGAKVTVVSPSLSAGLERRAAVGEVEVFIRPFRPDDIDGHLLVFAATDDPAVNRSAAEESARRGALCNVADRPALGAFVVPSLVRQGPLQIAISTGGNSPAYARLVRERLEEIFGDEHRDFLKFLRQLRPRVAARYPDDEAMRRQVWERVVRWEMLDLVREGRWNKVEEVVSACLS